MHNGKAADFAVPGQWPRTSGLALTQLPIPRTAKPYPLLVTAVRGMLHPDSIHLRCPDIPFGSHATSEFDLPFKRVLMQHAKDSQSKRSPPTPRDPSRPINATYLQRVRLFLLRRLLKPWTSSLAPRVLLLPFGLVLKFSRHVSLSEAHTLEFLSQNTKIPVPRVIMAFESKSGCRYILMSRIPGVPLSTVFNNLTNEQQRNILLQLRNYIIELRTLRSPQHEYIGAVDRTPLHDERVYDGPLGPFDSVASFQKALRRDIDENSGHLELDRLIEEEKSRDYSCQLTHGDLSFRNIIICGERITGIVDWETAGWYPDYWEYASTFYSFFDTVDLRPRVDEFLEPYPEKRKTEQMRRRLFNMM